MCATRAIYAQTSQLMWKGSSGVLISPNSEAIFPGSSSDSKTDIFGFVFERDGRRFETCLYHRCHVPSLSDDDRLGAQSLQPSVKKEDFYSNDERGQSTELVCPLGEQLTCRKRCDITS